MTPEELLHKQPTGKAFFANYDTYYNEIMASSNPSRYENYIGSKTLLQNSLPNIYAFIKLIDNPNLRKKIGMAGRETVIKDYSTDVLTKKYLKVINSI